MVRNKKVIITGSTGLLGLSLLKNKPADFDIYAGYYNFPKERLPKADVSGYILFDIKNKEEVSDIFKDIAPDYVVHAASIGSVDYCEKNKEEAWRTNVEGSRNIIEACRKTKATMVFMSSNAVFDGERPPYTEGDKTNPIDYYGQTKFQTEKDMASGGIRYAIVRLMTMYGWNHPLERQNPVTWAIERLARKESINVVDDIYNNHLYSENAAQAIWAMLEKNSQGIYHIAGGEIVSRYELALRTAEVFGFDKGLIRPVNSSFFPSIAPRPKNTSYRIDKMEKELAVKGINIRDGLILMKNNMPKE